MMFSMMPGPICKPNAHARKDAARKEEAPRGGGDAFSFGAGSANDQTMQNMMVMMTAPWAALWAMQSELAEETMRRAFFF